ncbi:MAG: helix-turn-helix transcriptional regulator, partial [Polyangiaceae bacterium]|nr:helix-turn-helix transcriptional regulator [Polyangiaceae bacterium]
MLETASPRWELYRALAEPLRLRLLALAAEEELAIGELAELLDESQPNVSRHAASLKQAGLVSVHKQGTRSLLRLRDDARRDPVVLDAVRSGRALCEADGSLGRVESVVLARDAVGRE